MFARAHKTVGLMMSEQEGESKHAMINAELRPQACVRDASEKFLLALRRDELRSRVNKKMLTVASRLCSTCKINGIREFLRAGKDGQRHCRNCDKDMF